MSADPAARLRRAYSAFNAGHPDWTLIDPTIRFDQTEGLFLDGVFFGTEGVRAALEEIESDWEDLSYDVLDVVQDGDRVLALLRMRARVRDSQAELDAQVAHVWQFRDGRAVRWDVYADYAAARRAFNGLVSQPHPAPPQALL